MHGFSFRLIAASGNRTHNRPLIRGVPRCAEHKSAALPVELRARRGYEAKGHIRNGLTRVILLHIWGTGATEGSDDGPVARDAQAVSAPHRAAGLRAVGPGHTPTRYNPGMRRRLLNLLTTVSLLLCVALALLWA